MKTSQPWDVVVVGAGAAGLLAAARAAARGRRTLLLEKNRKVGVKILMSGGTRCNLTHHTDARGIIDQFAEQGRFLHSPLAALGPAELVQLIEHEGVPTKVEATGKVFPVSDRAADVVLALVGYLRRSRVELALAEPLVEVAREANGFRLRTSHRTLQAAKLIVTTGGQSYPGCGTTGDGYAWLRQLGHSIVQPRPALVPITTSSEWVADLQGLTIPEALVSVEDARTAGKRPLTARRGSILFTHFGISGPAVLDVSRVVSRHQLPRTLELVCDFRPDQTVDQIEAELQTCFAGAGKRQVTGVLAQWLPKRLADCCRERARIPVGRRGSEVSREERRALLQAIKSTRIRVAGTLGFKKAEVTAGGVALQEVDSRTMQSKIVPHLYVAGELLDLDGPIGGYNFQAAFSTGYLAGECV